MQEGTLVVNGINYSGRSASPSGSGTSAADINYDNTNSGLDATTAQGAIDELVDTVLYGES